MNISEDIHRAVVEGDWSSIHQGPRDDNLPRPASSRRRSKRDRLEHPVVLECRGPVGLSE